jgi:hypothetical protein
MKMFILNENPVRFSIFDNETIGKFKTYEEAKAYLEDYAKQVPFVSYIRIIDTEYKRREEWYTWGKDGKLVGFPRRGKNG